MLGASPLPWNAPDSSSDRRPRTKHFLIEWVQRVGFWTAVATPFVLVGLLLTGLAQQHVSLFVGLLGANVVSLGLGHGHELD